PGKWARSGSCVGGCSSWSVPIAPAAMRGAHRPREPASPRWLPRSDWLMEGELRGIDSAPHRPLLDQDFQGWPLEAEGDPLVDLGHRCDFKGGEQMAHRLPQPALRPLLLPRLLEQWVALLLHLVNQERQHHQQREHLREVLVTVSVV